VPDVVGYADLLAQATEFCRSLHRRIGVQPTESVLTFPYPNTTAKIRDMSILSPGDLVAYRAAAGHIARITDPLLGDEGSFKAPPRGGSSVPRGPTRL
jgi:hypothetical protein